MTDELKKWILLLFRTTPNFTSHGHHMYCISNRNEHVFGTAFSVAQRWNRLVLNFLPIDEKLLIRIKGRFKNYSLINALAVTNVASDEEKDSFCEKLSKAYNDCPKLDIKIVLGDMNA